MRSGSAFSSAFSMAGVAVCLLFVMYSGMGCASSSLLVLETRSETNSPSSVLKQVCFLGKEIQTTQGTVWMKLKSPEANGQFIAQAQAKSDNLRLEVVNFLGGTEAIIQIQGSEYQVRNSKGRLVRKGIGENGIWGGLPMKWASDLFLGKIPCPDSNFLSQARVEWEDRDGIVVRSNELPGEFHYLLNKREDDYWPVELHWRNGLQSEAEAISMDFKFDQPDKDTLSPKAWEAKSSRGDIKIRWREREVELEKVLEKAEVEK